MTNRWPPPLWDNSREALQETFGLKRRDHFLSLPRGVFPSLREPQITKAICNLLTGTPSRTLRRCQALFDALGGASAPRLKQVTQVTADDRTRMDLAIHAVDENGMSCCLVLEAKLESELSDTQLKKYRKILLKTYSEKRQRHLWVVAPLKTARTTRVMGRSINSEWKFVSWRRLLLAWQRALDDDGQPEAAGLFNEIWSRIGGR